MRLRTLTLCTALVAATLGTPTLHAAPFTPEQEARIKELIRETLVANPKILDEAAESWEKQNAAAQEAQLGDFIKGNQDVLFNSTTSPRLGAKHPKLTLVLFTDYNCPYCKQFDPQLTKLLKAYPDDLGLVIAAAVQGAELRQGGPVQPDPVAAGAGPLPRPARQADEQAGMLTERTSTRRWRPPATPPSSPMPRPPRSCATACASAPSWRAGHPGDAYRQPAGAGCHSL
jgi:thiol-disulfide isomerase/thioredoxin